MNETPPAEMDSVIIRDTKISECILGRKIDFQDVLRGIDFELSKFDSPVVGSSINGPVVVLD